MSVKPGSLERKTTATRAAEVLRSRILRGDLRAGAALLQDTIAEELGVSRIPVREALRHLEAEGLVTLVAHRGAVVSSFSLDEVSETFELRALVECAVLTRAVPLAAPADGARAAAILDDFEAALRDGADLDRCADLNREFHLSLYAPAHRPRSMSIIRNLYDHADRYAHIQLSLVGAAPRANAEHRRLLGHYRRGRAQMACRVLRRHILDTGRSLVDFLGRHKPRETARAPLCLMESD